MVPKKLFVASVIIFVMSGCASWYERITHSVALSEEIAKQLSDDELKVCLAERHVDFKGERVNCLLHGKNSSINKRKAELRAILRNEAVLRNPQWSPEFKKHVLSGTLEPGMSQDQVAWVRGTPEKQSVKEGKDYWFYKNEHLVFNRTKKLI